MAHVNYKDVVIGINDSVKHALEVLDARALRIALICDQSDKLLGVVTDGDIRRGILNGVTLTDTVEQVMHRSPVTITKDVPRRQAAALMQAKNILAIPVVENGYLIGLETLQKFKSASFYDNPVFIMAGGFGTRLRPLTDDIPKPMLKVGDKPILETIIRNFIQSGFSNFYISTHYLPEVIRDYFGDGSKWNISITYVHEEQPLGTGGALGLLPKNLPELPMVVVNGDILTSVDIERVLEFHNERDATATMCVREYDYQIPYGVINGDGERIVDMEEKPIQRFFVNAGIYVLSPAIYLGVPPGRAIDMPTLLQQHINKSDKVLMFPIHEYWLDIGRMDDFEKAQIDVRGLAN